MVQQAITVLRAALMYPRRQSTFRLTMYGRSTPCQRSGRQPGGERLERRFAGGYFPDLLRLRQTVFEVAREQSQLDLVVTDIDG
jgi:hypothetical protein